MGDPVVVESWHLPRALSDEALRLLTSLPMDEIERRLRTSPPRPISVSKRLPGPGDCLPWPDEPSADPWCWLGSNIDGGWEWEQRSAKSLSYHNEFTHWLPAHALPLPEVK